MGVFICLKCNEILTDDNQSLDKFVCLNCFLKIEKSIY